MKSLILSLLLIGLLGPGCSLLEPKNETPRRERDREAMIDCAKRLYDVGMSEEGVRAICNDAMGKLSK
jgi:hypothetical protein